MARKLHHNVVSAAAQTESDAKNIADHLNECNAPSRNLLNAAIKRAVRVRGEPQR